MRSILAVMLACATGCGAILNSGTATVTVPPGATVDGVPGTVQVSQKRSHQVQLPSGQRCVIESGVSGGYVVADILLTGLLGVIIDGVTADWNTLHADECPGVSVN